MTKQYPAIEDLAIVGNGRTAALVDREGSIVWCCWPRFDSPAQFCQLLDANRGGYFKVAPKGACKTERKYLKSTNILQTTFTTAGGVARLTDFMPAPVEAEGEPVIPHRILRRIECAEGKVEIEVAFRPTFHFAKASASYDLQPEGVLARGAGEALGLATPLHFHISDDIAHGTEVLSAGEYVWLVLTHGKEHETDKELLCAPKDAERELERTDKYWSRWADRCSYQGPYRDQVIRSALVLKLLVYQPGGSLIAAPTTSLPAEIGGVRNWDYRYTWLRDSGLLLDALQQLGYHDESKHFIEWLEQLPIEEEDELRVVYAIDGGNTPKERTLDHLDGYRDSGPVHVGNGAGEQTQIDTCGHVIDATVLCYERMPREMKPELWQLLCTLANRIASRWREQDKGPWEIRLSRKHYLYSKLYCWVGLDRAIRFAERNQLPGDQSGWKSARGAIRESILQEGYNPEAGAFTQAYGSSELDASALTIPLVGLLDASDLRVQSTAQRIEEKLTDDHLVYRYRMVDGLPGSDATFTLCGFWLVMNWALMGRASKAVELFERICSFANDVGLLSEQIDEGTETLLGNFPQGFSHLGLIRAALYLGEMEPRS